MASCALNSLNVDVLDLEGILHGLEKGDFTSQDLVETYTSRIAQINAQVTAVGCLNPDARAIAKERDQQRQDGLILGALHGVPLLVKDTIVTADGMDTTGGSYALVGAKYSHEATIVTKIREAGGIILGKTNLSQWGMSRSPKCPSGWTSLFGQAVGGFHESQDPQGSSSGSAIAACQKLAAATIGAETCGSILYPAQRNGVVGLKPTMGLTSRAGTIPINPEQDSIGPLTSWVKDSAIILQAIAGEDGRDSATNDIPFTTIPDYVGACRTSGLKDMRVAVPRSVYKTADSDPEVGTAFKDAIDKIRSLGATVVDDIDFDHWKPGGGQREDLFGDILLREALERFFSTITVNPNNINNVSDLIEFLKSTPEEQYEKFGAEWFENARDAPGNSSSDTFFESKKKMEDLGKDVEKLLDKHQCDVILATSSTDLPLDLGGLPGISVPLGFYSDACPVVWNSKGQVTKGPNIPFAITFAGRRFSEETIFSCAYSFEQATKVAEANNEKLRIKPQSEKVEWNEECQERVTRL